MRLTKEQAIHNIQNHIRDTGQVMYSYGIRGFSIHKALHMEHHREISNEIKSVYEAINRESLKGNRSIVYQLSYSGLFDTKAQVKQIIKHFTDEGFNVSFTDLSIDDDYIHLLIIKIKG